MEGEAAISAWGFAVIGGPIVMGVVLAWLVVRNRRRRRGQGTPARKRGGVEQG